jgi:hypothetical protein
MKAMLFIEAALEFGGYLASMSIEPWRQLMQR